MRHHRLSATVLHQLLSICACDGSGQAAATQERLEAAAAAKEEADRAAKLAQGQRRAHTAGRLTAEEKARPMLDFAFRPLGDKHMYDEAAVLLAAVCS